MFPPKPLDIFSPEGGCSEDFSEMPGTVFFLNRLNMEQQVQLRLTKIACKISHNLSSCNPPKTRKLLVSPVITLFDGQHIRQSFSIACNSDSEILAVLQTEETVVRT